MKTEERKQLLKDTLLYFAASDRYVTDEEGVKYYREDVTLKAMELSEQLPSELLRQRDELLEALIVCHASLLTYGSHPLIDEQVKIVITKAEER